MDFQTHLIWSNFPFLIQGLWLTLSATAVALFIGIIQGGLFCALKLSNNVFIYRLSTYYITFFRTTPEMILIFWGYFCIPLITQQKISGFWSGSIILGFVTAAYLAEIFRAGIEAIPKGQIEASFSLSIPIIPRWRFIILPQALKLMVPPLVNYFTELIKNTTLLSAIGVAELALQAYLLGGQTYRYLEFLSAIAFIYFVIIFPFTLFSRRFEKINELN